MSDRGEALHVAAEQMCECLGLCLAQLWVLPGDMRHGAVVLANLNASRRGVDARGEAELTQRGGEGSDLLGLAGSLPVVAQDAAEAVFECGAARFGERSNRSGAAHLLDERERIGGQRVVLGGEPGSSLFGQGEGAGRSAATTRGGRPVRWALGRRDKSVVQKGVEMAAHRRRADADADCEPRGGGRTVGQQGRCHPIASGSVRPVLRPRLAQGGTLCRLGARGDRSDFHNAIVA